MTDNKSSSSSSSSPSSSTGGRLSSFPSLGNNKNNNKNNNNRAYSTIGTAANAVSFVVVAAYLASVFLFADANDPENSGPFDPLWVQHGFCVSMPDARYRTSHDVCFCLDTISCAFCVWIFYRLRDGFGSGGSGGDDDDEKRNAVAADAINSTFFFQSVAMGLHGVAHELIAHVNRNTVTSIQGHYTIADVDRTVIWAAFVLLVVFYYFLLRGTLTNFSSRTDIILFVAIGASVLTLLVGTSFAFAVVQGVVILAYCINSLFERYKNTLFYCMMAVVCSLPAVFVPWIESTSCSDFLVHYGGHIWYDLCIPIGLIITYVTVYLDRNDRRRVKEEIPAKTSGAGHRDTSAAVRKMDPSAVSAKIVV